ncbi:type I restriction-modification system subunit M [Miltoncostaea marina]|uniref:type I restriction-modification system subunit M n=1 Tax=Miltoncostaea marina TaxID=2843215 RepID=UPI001C3E58CB|nr:class I SAM-dependent DNA methyltransferase [Miltoncostaea marina]
MSQLRNHAAFIWSIAETLRGPYKRSEYGHVILPFTLMRRLDQAMEDTKDAVVAEAKRRRDQGIENVEPLLRRVAGRMFFNSSPLRFSQLPADPRHIATNLAAYIDGYSEHAGAVFANFDFERQIQRLEEHDLLHAVVSKMCEVDLAPERVSNLEMGYTFEELIRRFAESSNDEAGEHFTPREVVRLMVNLLLAGDEEALAGSAPIRTVYDCACGTGGMLSEAEAHIRSINPRATVHLFGQEVNPQSYAICLADMLIRGQDPSHVVRANTLTSDAHRGEHFHYGIANPPFGRDWKGEYPTVKKEFDAEGSEGRFAPGLPGKDDGQTLFLLQLLSKMKPAIDQSGDLLPDGGSRVAIVHNGSPLFSGGPGSGLSEIRRHVIENDLLETIVALPEQLFYNTASRRTSGC